MNRKQRNNEFAKKVAEANLEVFNIFNGADLEFSSDGRRKIPNWELINAILPYLQNTVRPHIGYAETEQKTLDQLYTMSMRSALFIVADKNGNPYPHLSFYTKNAIRQQLIRAEQHNAIYEGRVLAMLVYLQSNAEPTDNQRLQDIYNEAEPFGFGV